VGDEFLETFDLCTAQTLVFAAKEQETKRPLTAAEEARWKARTPKDKGNDRGRKDMEQMSQMNMSCGHNRQQRISIPPFNRH